MHAGADQLRRTASSVTLDLIWIWTSPRRRAEERLRRGRKECDERRGPGDRQPRPVRMSGAAAAAAALGPAVTVWPAAPRRRPAPDRAVRADLCGARPRHQQLPAAGRAPDRRQLPRDRCVLPHHPAGRGRIGIRPHQRSGHQPRRRCARHLPRQDAQPRRDAGAPDRHRGLPRGGERRRVSCAHRRAGRARARDHRPRDRGDARRDRLHAAGRSAGRRRDPVRHRRRLLGDRPARSLAAGAARPAAAEDQGLGLASGRRGHAGRASRRTRGHAARSTRR